MVKGKLVAIENQQKILTLKEEGYSVSEIVKKCKIPQRTVYRIIQRGNLKKKKEYPIGYGKKKVLSDRDKRRIKRKLKKEKLVTLRKITSDLNLPVSKSTMSRTIKDMKFKRKKLKTKPILKPQHKQARLLLARKTVQWNKEWKKVYFTDEKKFNLDGPDGWNYYWHDLQNDKEKNYFSKDIHKKQSVMVWGAFSETEKLPLFRLQGKINGDTYSLIIENELYDRVSSKDFILLQDNAPIHTSKVVKKKIKKLKIKVLDWPAYSPDLNPIENLWSYIVRDIYSDGKSYDNTDELWKAIQKSWSKIPKKIIKNLVDSMNKRMIALLENGGKSLKF